MSRAIALVRFTDGHIAAAVYTGTTDTVRTRLHDLADATQPLRTRPPLLPELVRSAISRAHRPSDTAPVEIWTSYGGGMHWFGSASRRRRILLAGSEPYVGPRTPPLDGTPAWVPSTFHDHGDETDDFP
jgi:hypothetical protein